MGVSGAVLGSGGGAGDGSGGRTIRASSAWIVTASRVQPAAEAKTTTRRARRIDEAYAGSRVPTASVRHASGRHRRSARRARARTCNGTSRTALRRMRIRRSRGPEDCRLDRLRRRTARRQSDRARHAEHANDARLHRPSLASFRPFRPRTQRQPNQLPRTSPQSASSVSASNRRCARGQPRCARRPAELASLTVGPHALGVTPPRPSAAPVVESDEDSNPIVAFVKALPADQLAQLEELARLDRLHPDDIER